MRENSGGIIMREKTVPRESHQFYFLNKRLLHVHLNSPFTRTVPDQRATGPESSLCCNLRLYCLESHHLSVYFAFLWLSALGGLCSDFIGE